jgi:hypothetical protein
MLALMFAWQLMAQAPGQTQDVNVNVNSCRICGLISALGGDAKERHRKAVGKMLATGDCVAAEKYALEKGDFELAEYAKSYCARSPAASVAPAPVAPPQR